MADWLQKLLSNWMHFLCSLSGGDWAVFAIAFFPLVGLIVWLRVHQRDAIVRWLEALHLPVHALSWLADTSVILIAFLAAVLWAFVVNPPVGLCLDNVFEVFGSSIEAEAIAWVCLFAGLVMLTRVGLSPFLFLVSVTAWVLLGSYQVLHVRYLPTLEAIRRDVTASCRALTPSLFLPGMFVQGWRFGLWMLISFLSGIYFVRNRFAWWKFVLGSLLGGYAVLFFITPILWTSSQYPFVQPLVWTGFGALLLCLPTQRRSLERLFEMPLRGTSEPRVHIQRSLPVSILGHLCLLAMIAGLMALAFVGFFERRQMSFISGFDGPRYHMPGERNAFPFQRRRFLRPVSKDALARVFGDVAFTATTGDPVNILDAEGWAKADLPKIRAGLRDLAPYLDDFTSASLCDYYEEPTGSSARRSFLPVRETARALHTKAMLDIHDGNTTAALESIAALVGYSWLSKDSPSLVLQMIGVAVAGNAGDALYNYYMALRRNPAAMEDLSRFLEERRDRLSIRLDDNALRLGDLMDVMPNTEFMVPAAFRADHSARGRALQFQQLRLAAALECYKARHGQYPETLDALVPEFMPILPLDPFSGRPHKYEPHEDDFSLTSACKPEPDAANDRFRGPYKFPPLSPDEVHALRVAAKKREVQGKGKAQTTATVSMTTATAR